MLGTLHKYAPWKPTLCQKKASFCRCWIHYFIDQMAEWYIASASGSEGLESNDLKIVFTAFLLDVQHLRDRVEKAGKFTCCVVGKGT